ncbi:hypothetical protein VNO77_36353 [Canavalia gladiata]|uniref:Uncharacterized protein n=1 Tax=Canavalia gladiata TaxID=3824 RepID=A0AAN9PWK6_CANGL
MHATSPVLALTAQLLVITLYAYSSRPLKKRTVQHPNSTNPHTPIVTSLYSITALYFLLDHTLPHKFSVGPGMSGQLNIGVETMPILVKLGPSSFSFLDF